MNEYYFKFYCIVLGKLETNKVFPVVDIVAKMK